jgi:hypothetical protein
VKNNSTPPLSLRRREHNLHAGDFPLGRPCPHKRFLGKPLGPDPRPPPSTPKGTSTEKSSGAASPLHGSANTARKDGWSGRATSESADPTSIMDGVSSLFHRLACQCASRSDASFSSKGNQLRSCFCSSVYAMASISSPPCCVCDYAHVREGLFQRGDVENQTMRCVIACVQ